MREQALRILKDVFGYDAFRGNQARIIERVAEGGDALVLMPTGGGKSLCFQVPALLREGLTVVVSPLIALMEDQVATLDELGVPAVALNSTSTPSSSGHRRAPAARRDQAALPGTGTVGPAAHAGLPATTAGRPVRHRRSALRVAMGP